MPKKDYFRGKNGPYIIAEIGGNHEGDFQYAKHLTKLAAQTGVDAVKFQIYTGGTLVNKKYDPTRYKHFKKFQLKKKEYIELANLCKNLGTNFMASVWDLDAVSYIDPFIQIYKIGSGDLTSYNLIEKFMLTSKPIIISTGLAKFQEVENVLNFVNKINPSYIKENKIALLQCSSMYPIPDSDANLNVINTYKKKFGIPVGYSDHTKGSLAIEIAVAMGAQIIETHFTDSRDKKTFRDHQVSLTKDELKKFIYFIKKVKILKGSYKKKPTKSEINHSHVHSFRRAVYAARNLPKQHIIKKSDLITRRPNKGISADNFYQLVGSRLNRPVKKNAHFNFSYFEKKKFI